VNLGLDYLPGSITFDPVAGPAPAADEASAIVWMDALTTNVDRTARNPNLLTWHRNLWLIDHGAALYFHHTWADEDSSSRGAFAAIKDHVLLRWATRLASAGERLAPALGRDVIERVLGDIPDDWLADEPRFATPAAYRAAYAGWLTRRLASASVFTEEAERARVALV
jgi:hypothetical protein